MKYLKLFNQRLRDMREIRCLSQQDIADFCLVDSSVVETWESEKPDSRCYPSVANLLDICFKTGSTLESFVDMPETPIEKQLALPGLNLGEDNDLANSLVELGEQIEKLIPVDDELELLRRYRKSDSQTKELILQLITN